MISVVWLKKDLRLHDHAPLLDAAASGKVLLLWLQEPSLWQAQDSSERHQTIETLCAQSLAADLQSLGGQVWTTQQDALPAFEALRHACVAHGGMAIFSHEETGNGASYARDLALLRWCKQHGIAWVETPRNGVVRRLKSRNDWGKHWAQRMRIAPFAAPEAEQIHFFAPSIAGFTALAAPPAAQRDALYLRHTAAGSHARLNYFLSNELRNYRFGMSSPVTAPLHCSRLSTQLAFGVLSVRQVIDAVWGRRLVLKDSPLLTGQLQGLKSFEGRLHWHCHFIQKLEDEPRIEFVNMHRGYDGLRERDFNTAHFEAWQLGMTGVPMVDACMRRLNATGWINFRMRAMLMSFAAYHLWLHWREPGLHLARQFSDYEPGIHYAQIQMQSGTTGINAARIYNPVKQALDQDARGDFIRRWCPELARVPIDFLPQPWLLTLALQTQYGCVLGRDYPEAIIDVAQAGREAKERFHAWRKQSGMAAVAQQVFEKHGSRSPQRSGQKAGKPLAKTKPSAARTATQPQATLSLFEP